MQLECNGYAEFHIQFQDVKQTAQHSKTTVQFHFAIQLFLIAPFVQTSGMLQRQELFVGVWVIHLKVSPVKYVVRAQTWILVG